MSEAAPLRALFVNSGILGQRTFASFVDQAFAGGAAGVRARQVVISEGLSTRERVVRRLLCTRLWPDGLGGMRNLDLHRFRAELNAGLVARGRIRALERRGERFDVLHFHRQATAYASVGRMRRTPSVVSVDCTQGYLIGRSRSAAEARSYLANRWYERRIFDAARAIVTPSQWAADLLRADYPRCETPIHVMPNPVRLEVFDPGWIERRRQRAAVPYLPRVLFVGGDFDRKGGADLLAAWEAGGFGNRARLDLVTNVGPSARELAGVTVHTGVRGFSPEWRALWEAADLFVLPTHDDAFPNVLEEAAAAGLPAIATRVGGIPEVLRDEETGLVIEAGDRPALAAAMDRLLQSEPLRAGMGARARSFIEHTADPIAYRDRLAELFRMIAAPRPSP